MDFQIAHEFDVPAHELWMLLRRPDFLHKLSESAGVEVKILDDQSQPGLRILRMEMTGKRALPEAIARSAGTDRLRYQQENRIRDIALMQTWAVRTDLFPDRFQADGEMRVVALSAQRCQRIVKGTVRVGVPVVGVRIERHIVEQLTQGYERASQLTRAWLEAPPPLPRD